MELVTRFDGTAGFAAARRSKVHSGSGTVAASHFRRITHRVASPEVAKEVIILIDSGIDATMVQMSALCYINKALIVGSTPGAIDLAAAPRSLSHFLASADYSVSVAIALLISQVKWSVLVFCKCSSCQLGLTHIFR
jgi:hypothetical protein